MPEEVSRTYASGQRKEAETLVKLPQERTDLESQGREMGLVENRLDELYRAKFRGE